MADAAPLGDHDPAMSSVRASTGATSRVSPSRTSSSVAVAVAAALAGCGRPASTGLAALLWYWPQEWKRRHGAAIYTGGEMPQGWSAKVLWSFVGRAQKGRGGRELTVRGTRLDAHGTFTQRFGAISYGGQGRAPSFASIVDVPNAGCWRLDVSTAELRARVVVRAIRAPARQ